jgi:hypothetical protein
LLLPLSSPTRVLKRKDPTHKSTEEKDPPTRGTEEKDPQEGLKREALQDMK